MKTQRLLLLLASTPIFAKHPKIAHDLETAGPARTVNVIFHYKRTPTGTHHQKVCRQAANCWCVWSTLREDCIRFRRTNWKMADDPDVAYITPDRPLHTMMDVTRTAVRKKRDGITAS